MPELVVTEPWQALDITDQFESSLLLLVPTTPIACLLLVSSIESLIKVDLGQDVDLDLDC